MEKLTRFESVAMNLQEHVLNLTGRRVEDPENRSGSNDLIVHGIPEKGDETEAALRGSVKSMFQDKMKMSVMSIERIHRLGRKQETITRPVILRLYGFNEKIQLLRIARALWSSGVDM